MPFTFAVATIQAWIFLILALGMFVLEAWAFIAAVRAPSGAYVSAGKKTKAFWGALTGIAALVGFLSLPIGGGGLSALGLLSLAAVVVAGVFLADVRPAIRPYLRRRPPQNPGRSGGW
jgi:hypothetical protein